MKPANEPVIKISEWNGLRNTVQGDRQPLASLVTADNVYLDDSKALVKRDGYTQVSAQTGQSIFATRDESRLYLIDDDGVLHSVNSGFQLSMLADGFTGPVSWDENAPWVFVNAGRYGFIGAANQFHDLRLPAPSITITPVYGSLPIGRYQVAVIHERHDGMQGAATQQFVDVSNGGLRITTTPQAGYKTIVYCSTVDSGETYRVAYGEDVTITSEAQMSTSPLSAEQQNASSLPETATWIAWHQGRIYAVDYQPQHDYTALWISLPFFYQLFNLATDGISLPGKVLDLASYGDGLLIATDKAIWDYTIDGNLVQRFPYGAIEGYPIAVGTDGRVWCWTKRGLISVPDWKEAQFGKYNPKPGSDCFVTELLYKGSRQIAAFTDGAGHEATHY